MIVKLSQGSSRIFFMYLKSLNIYLRGYFGFMAFQTFICVEIYFKLKNGPFISFFYLVYLILHSYHY